MNDTTPLEQPANSTIAAEDDRGVRRISQNIAGAVGRVRCCDRDVEGQSRAGELHRIELSAERAA